MKKEDSIKKKWKKLKKNWFIRRLLSFKVIIKVFLCIAVYIFIGFRFDQETSRNTYTIHVQIKETQLTNWRGYYLLIEDYEDSRYWLTPGGVVAREVSKALSSEILKETQFTFTIAEEKLFSFHPLMYFGENEIVDIRTADTVYYDIKEHNSNEMVSCIIYNVLTTIALLYIFIFTYEENETVSHPKKRKKKWEKNRNG